MSKPTRKQSPDTDLRSGHCTRCKKLIWRACKAQKEISSQRVVANQEYLLWPLPDSVYAVVRTPTGVGNGIAFCRECAPAIGESINAQSPNFAYGAPVLAIETALSRYPAWFAPHRREFYEAWLRDAMSYDAKKIVQFMDYWELDGGVRADDRTPVRTV